MARGCLQSPQNMPQFWHIAYGDELGPFEIFKGTKNAQAE